MPRYYVLEGRKPVRVEDPQAWIEWYSKSIRERVLAHHEINGKLVRTVFTGLDFGGKRGRPCLFDSYIWDKHAEDPEHAESHSTYDSAIEAHRRLIEALENGISNN
jgi:hypothetical protein